MPEVRTCALEGCTEKFSVPPSSRKKYHNRECALKSPQVRRNLGRDDFIHRLTDIDEANRRANCAQCGPVSVMRGSRRKLVYRIDGEPEYRWRCYTDHRNKGLSKAYGISFDTYIEMAIEQDGLCAICQKPSVLGKHLRVDHDHETGAVRGLLCDGCNVALGFVYEDVRTLQRMIDYLNKHSN